MAIELIVGANAAGARLVSACCELGISLRTLKRWRHAFGGDGDGEDRRKGSSRLVSHRLSEEERQRILLTCNQPEYASLPPGQFVSALADQGHYIGSESSFSRVLHQAGQCQRRGRARPPQAPRTVPRLRADGPNPVWSWDIERLPTTVVNRHHIGDHEPLPAPLPIGIAAVGVAGVGAGRIDVEHRLLRGSLQRLSLRIRQSGARALADPCNRPTADLHSKLLIEQRPGLAETQRDGTAQQAH
jgi:hypothetical protein